MEAFDDEEDEETIEETNDQFIKIFDEFRREVALFSTMQHSRIVDLKGSSTLSFFPQLSLSLSLSLSSLLYSSL
jgi:hypothetical protein